MESGSFIRMPWYRRWWGKVILGLGGALAILAVVFVSFIIKYSWEISHGNSDILAREFAGQRFSFTAVKGPLAAPAAVNRAMLETPTSPFLGQERAPVTIVEFMDFKCPNSKLAVPILETVAGQFGNRVKIIVRELPAESIHPGASQLAALAVCANAQHRFWPLYDLLFSKQDQIPASLANDQLAAIGDQVGLDRTALSQCLTSDATGQEVQRDYLAGVAAGARGTPTFFVNGEKVEGVVPLALWQKYLSTVK